MKFTGVVDDSGASSDRSTRRSSTAEAVPIFNDIPDVRPVDQAQGHRNRLANPDDRVPL